MENLKAWFIGNGFEDVKSGIASLKSELGIKVKEYPESDLYVFNYCQIESPKTHPAVIESRGLILRNDFSVVCRPFNRFFNLGEALELTSEFSIKDAIAFEKVDGSLVKMYHDGERWQVATRGTAFAESENYTGKIFQDMIVEAFGFDSLEALNKRANPAMYKNLTYIFEFTSPENRVVTAYTEPKMYLLGIRSNKLVAEVTPDQLKGECAFLNMIGLKCDTPKVFRFDSEADMREYANTQLEGLEEGFVAHDLQNNIRVKLKADLYVQVHRLRGDSVPTPKRIMGLVVTNETEEYLAYFPTERDRFQPFINVWEDLRNNIVSSYETVSTIEDQKEFALAVKDLPFSHVLFSARKMQIEPLHILDAADVSRRVALLDKVFS